MIHETERVLEAIAEDMRGGFVETVGIKSRLSLAGDRCSMVLELPHETNARHIANAIDMENVEAWCDSDNRVNIAVSPWFSTKDVDQAVLCAIKVIHVLLGLHAAGKSEPLSFSQKLLKSITDIIQIQQDASKNK